MFTYTRTVHYYETDMMGVTHHANYIHLMEEARIAFMDNMGYSYHRLEQEGIVSPVTALQCKYHAPTTFNDAVTVQLRIAAFNGAVLTMAYEMHKADGTLVFSARSDHSFLDRQGHFVRLRRDFPAFYQLLTDSIEPDA